MQNPYRTRTEPVRTGVHQSDIAAPDSEAAV